MKSHSKESLRHNLIWTSSHSECDLRGQKSVKARIQRSRYKPVVTLLMFAFLNIIVTSCSSVKETDPKVTNVDKFAESSRLSQVQALVKELASESSELRRCAYNELRDSFLRKRDIPWLKQVVEKSRDLEVNKSLKQLILFMEQHWRLPDKAWTTDLLECAKRYREEFDRCGIDASIAIAREGRSKFGIDILISEEGQIPVDKRSQIIDLILILEPEILGLAGGGWSDTMFLAQLVNLEEFALYDTQVADLNPLKGLQNLTKLTLENAKFICDITPLGELESLATLQLIGTNVTDLAPLKSLSRLNTLLLKNSIVSDLRPLEGMRSLRVLMLENTNVTDLTSIQRVNGLSDIYLDDKSSMDLSPLEGLAELKIHKLD